MHVVHYLGPADSSRSVGHCPSGNRVISVSISQLFNALCKIEGNHQDSDIFVGASRVRVNSFTEEGRCIDMRAIAGLH